MATPSPICDFGAKIVDFALPDPDGHIHRLTDLVGPKGMLVMFICNHCPYVKAVLDRIVRDARELQDQGIGVVAISANDATIYPEDSPENMKTLALDYTFSFPYLYDEDQSIARAYGAACTPDFFGYNDKGELQYRGRLDASGRTAGPENAKRDLYDAMIQIAQTGQGPRDQIPSMGCSIKWK